MNYSKYDLSTVDYPYPTTANSEAVSMEVAAGELLIPQEHLTDTRKWIREEANRRRHANDQVRDNEYRRVDAEFRKDLEEDLGITLWPQKLKAMIYDNATDDGWNENTHYNVSVFVDIIREAQEWAPLT